MSSVGYLLLATLLTLCLEQVLALGGNSFVTVTSGGSFLDGGGKIHQSQLYEIHFSSEDDASVDKVEVMQSNEVFNQKITFQRTDLRGVENWLFKVADMTPCTEDNYAVLYSSKTRGDETYCTTNIWIRNSAGEPLALSDFAPIFILSKSGFVVNLSPM